MTHPTARHLVQHHDHGDGHRHHHAPEPFDTCTLTYDARLLRRKMLTTDGGTDVLVDLEHTTSLNDGDLLALDDGRTVGIRAADEPLYRVTGDLARLAWHIGNRHMPCQFADDHLLILRDPVIGHMLADHLGATVTVVEAPFRPEGGAYGHGRTLPHAH
ncbi:urease accessory protein [Loktanella fryxellensis]|uniref:Urease accessory protein UreE n=1 Tax=Loktanella fryxellensis TaxID=245187 RepID=A0A1H8CLX4_9RHOB|nr:urease accessory protein UreE [Loktanella fryxellensis]SEM96035.1 urease accessory protein [Loktanella fryxellensis]